MSDAMTAENAEEYTQALEQTLGGSWRQVALADRLGVPAALSLTTREWVDRLGGYVRLAIPDRREAVAELVAEGMSQREVADVLGVGVGTVNRDLVPDGTPEPETSHVELPEPEVFVPDGTAEPEPLADPPPALTKKQLAAIAEAQQLAEFESECRAAASNMHAALIGLVSSVLEPSDFAETYRKVAGRFDIADLEYAIETLRAVVAIAKEN